MANSNEHDAMMKVLWPEPIPSLFSLDAVAYYKTNEVASAADFKFIGLALIGICLLRFVLGGAFHPYLRNFPSVFKSLATYAEPNLDLSRRVKFAENLWYTCWHTTSFISGVYLWSQESWSKDLVAGDLGAIWRNYPSHHMTPAFQTFYMIEVAFWMSCVLYLFVETKRKDFLEMVIHHFATLTLVGMSYYWKLYRVGVVVLFLHDIGDIFLYSAKSFSQLKKDFYVNILFTIFAIVFFISRLVLYPFIVWSAIYLSWPLVCTPYVHRVCYGAYYILPAMLCVLQVLHVVWYVMIVRMIYRAAKVKNVDGDIRSESEDEVETEIKKRKEKATKEAKKQK